MTKLENKNVKSEYEAFLNIEGVSVPSETSAKLVERLGKLLNPTGVSVFLKVFGIHLVVGFLSLSICHQFGVNPFHTQRSLSDWFMDMWGHNVCMIGCDGDRLQSCAEFV